MDKQPVIYESGTLELSCTTTISCPSRLQLLGVPTKEQSSLDDHRKNRRKIAASIIVTWMDDERNISCQKENNQDPYLIQRINLAIECELRSREFVMWQLYKGNKSPNLHSMLTNKSQLLVFISLGKSIHHMVIIDLNISLLFNFIDAPKNTIATVTSMDVNEGQMLSFSCSARGRPYPSFQWFHNGRLVSTMAQWTIRSIKYSQAGSYNCTAQNTHGKEKSQPLQINVYCKSIPYLPQFGIFFGKFHHITCLY